MAPKRGLGRGLSNLIPTDDTTEDVTTKTSKQTKTGTVTKTEIVKKVEQTLNINRIEPNKNQPRKEFNEDALQELADSIKQFGVIEPLVVVKRKGYYELIAGERRWRAARLAGLKEVPVVIKDYDDQQIVEIALIENIQREDLNPIEEASALQEMISRYELTQLEISQSVGKSRPYITNSLRLLKLPEAVQNLVEAGRLSGGHARAIAGVEDAELQVKLAEMAKDGARSVRVLEKMIADASEEREKKKRKTTEKNPEVIAIENELKEVFGTKVKLPKSADKGKFEISFYSRDELERLVEMLKSLKK